MLKRCLGALVVVSALAQFTPPVSHAAGNTLVVEPASAGVDTMIDISGDGWTPDVKVSFVAGYTPSLSQPPAAFSRPVAIQQANATGRLEVQIYVRDAPGITVPRSPGYVVFRATSADPQPRTAEAVYALVIDRRNPASAVPATGTGATAGWRHSDAAAAGVLLVFCGALCVGVARRRNAA